MRVATVHYHLKPGGVTRVVENAFASLEGQGIHLAAVAGEPYSGDALINSVVAPGLGYTQANEKPDPSALWFTIKKAARDALGGEPDVWHIHNHSLGKNTAMAQVVQKLASETPVLLQIHDFAEDGRPANYAALSGQMPNLDALYPQGSQVHYGLLNSRDLSILSECGFSSQSLHLLPNPVSVPNLPKERAVIDELQERPLILYPTRAIRRKNLGELLLWSAIQEGEAIFATTLSPANPTARPIHDRWMAFAEEQGLPVRFALGEHEELSFAELMTAADAIISTSVAEGFGLAFLEPFLFNRPLLGRNLTDITRDFTNTGVNLGALYDRLMVPLDWVGEREVRSTLSAALEKYYEAYGRELPSLAVDEAFAAMTDGNLVEFGRLSEPLQERVISRLKRNRAEAAHVQPTALGLEDSRGCVAGNRELIASNFSLARYGEHLANLYRKVAESPVEPLRKTSSGDVLDRFLDPRRFNLLRT